MNKQRLFHIIQIGSKDDIPSRFFDIFILANILLNITCMFLETFDELSYFFHAFSIIEYITLGVFCIEYGLRIWTADLLYPNKESYGKSILAFIISFEGIVDLLTILPFFYLSGFVAFRMLRVVRILHLFRINNQYDSFNVITSVLKEKTNQIASSVFIILILMLAASLGIYSAEHNAQPEAFPNAFSGLWWAVSCMLTVGYGDIYPITVAGKIMAIITAFLGVGVVAIPTGIISAGFVEQYSKIKQLADYNRETALNFVSIFVTHDHDWKNTLVKESSLPQGLAIALILRGKDVIIPKDDVEIKENDHVILAAKGYIDERDLKLTEKVIAADDPWADEIISNLDISRLTTIISIHRKNKVLLPSGDTRIKAGDHVVLYTKRH